MKKLGVFLFCLLRLSSLHADEIMTHYVTDNLRLRNSADLFSATIITLPQYTALKIIETGKTITIDGISAPWIKALSQTGYTGWCFSGYVKPIENNVAEDIAKLIAPREAGTYPKELSGAKIYAPVVTDTTSINEIKKATGYYIQQDARHFQQGGHKPEILKLSVENSIAYIIEIDIVNNNIVERKRIPLSFNGKRYQYDDSNTYLDLAGNNIHIVYRENMVKNSFEHSWIYNIYTYAGGLDEPIPIRVQRITTDYLKTFIGNYRYASHKIILVENAAVDLALLEKEVIRITFDESIKSLVAESYSSSAFAISERSQMLNDKEKRYKGNFVETTAEEPFYWSLGEGVGYIEDRYFFYKGGIAFTYDYVGVSFKETRNIDGIPIVDKNYRLKYVVFFKK